jgi:hypothetical protein
VATLLLVSADLPSPAAAHVVQHANPLVKAFGVGPAVTIAVVAAIISAAGERTDIPADRPRVPAVDDRGGARTAGQSSHAQPPIPYAYAQRTTTTTHACTHSQDDHVRMYTASHDDRERVPTTSHDDRVSVDTGSMTIGCARRDLAGGGPGEAEGDGAGGAVGASGFAGQSGTAAGAACPR